MFISFLSVKNHLLNIQAGNVRIYASYKKESQRVRGGERSKEENYAYILELVTRERQRVREEGGGILHSPAKLYCVHE